MACGRRHDVNFTDINRNKKINPVNNEIVLDVLLANKTKKKQEKRNINREKKLFRIYVLNIGSYQCMYMCINVP